MDPEQDAPMAARDRSLSILLVTHDQACQDLITNAFARAENHGSVAVVPTLCEAKEYLATQAPSLLIVDLDLSDGHGLDLLPGKIEQSPFPVIALSRESDHEAIALSIRARASDCVRKTQAAMEAMPRIAARVLRGWEHVQKRCRAENALRREREYLAGVAKAMPPVVIGMDRDGTIRLANLVCEQVSGYPASEMIGGNWCSVAFTGEESRQAAQMLREVEGTGQAAVREIPLTTRQGDKRCVAWDLTALRDDRGAIAELIALGADVTERKRAEVISRIQTSALLAVANCIVITDRDGYISWVNPSFTRSTGYGLEEVVGKTSRILRSGVHDERFYRDLWETILSGKVWQGVVVNRRKDGTLYDVEMTITPVPDEAGEITHFIAVKQDITERRKAERALETYADTLEQTTRELAEITRVAEQAREEAERASKVKSEFLAKMSHELRTPLNSIIGFTELMIEDRGDSSAEKRLGRLEKVHRNARNLLALINDILDLSKIEADRLSLDFERIDLACVIRECVESAQPLVKPGVRLTETIEPSLAQGANWYGDEIRIRQSLTNLLSNAVKFTECGHIEVRARMDEDHLVIEVEDTGIGIAADHLSRIFLEFEQVDASSTRRAGGTGLGLAITRRLCRLMQGEISVRSELGKGACFTIRLPRLSEDDVGAGEAAEVEVAGASLP